ncbi:MAG: threonylcarbamoyl-AMP synthase [Myxococcales bacterium]|nr:threonylcarbamoyl-AMP synthase [Myxococcales bacterium]
MGQLHGSKVVVVDPDHPDPSAIEVAAERLRCGGLVAFPTETVYGLGADATNADAVRRVYAAKGRPAMNPLIVHVADVAGAREVAEWSDAAQALADRFWPGPLTLVLPRRPSIPEVVSAGLSTVAVRVPDHTVALALLRAVALPIAAPSANRSGAVSPTCAAHVVASLADAVDLVVDGGPCQVGIESTVLLLGDPPTILRLGQVGRSELEAALGRAVVGPDEADVARPASPGMLLRHYAPRARLTQVPMGDAAAFTAARTPASGALVHSLEPGPPPHRCLPSDPEGYARGLYAALHELDALCEHIVVEAVPPTPEWAAVADRLGRALRG